jgi:transitional endoplasmic reticulum ATPase
MGDSIIIKPAGEIANGLKIHILPFSDTIEGITGSVTESHLIPYFKQNYRPLCKEDTFIISEGHFKAVEFKVIAIEVPPGSIPDKCIVTDNT